MTENKVRPSRKVNTQKEGTSTKEENKKGTGEQGATEEVGKISETEGVETVVIDSEIEVRVKKLNGGALYLPKKILKPGEIAWVRKSDIPSAFMDSIQILEERGGKTVVVKKKIYEAQEQEDGTFWVVNTETGKPISKDLEAEEASTIAQSLNNA